MTMNVHDQSVEVAILAAVRTEVAPLLSDGAVQAGKNRWLLPGQTQKQKKTAVVCVTGMGAARMTEAANELLDQYPISLLINAGFAGGLDPSLLGGQIITARQVRRAAGQCVSLLPIAVPGIEALDQTGKVTVADLVSVDQVVCDPSAKQTLARTTGAAAVDLEAFALAQLAADRQLPLLVLKAISDPADASLPVAAAEWVRADGSPDVLKAAWFALTHPWWIGRLRQLQRHATLGAHQLARQISRVLAIRQGESP